MNRVFTEHRGEERYAVYGASGFLGTATVMKEEMLLKVEKNFF